MRPGLNLSEQGPNSRSCGCGVNQPRERCVDNADTMQKIHSGEQQMTNDSTDPSAVVPMWRTLYRVGGLSALMAAGLELAAVVVSIIFSRDGASPTTSAGWFALLQNHRLVGLVYLGILDLFAVALMSMMFLAVCVALRRDHESSVTIAGSLAIMGIAVYLATNTVFPMMTLSDQYAAATTDAQKALFAAAGHAVLAIGGVGTGAYMAFLLMGVGGLVLSIVMFRTRMFARAIAWTGIVANVATLIYCGTSVLAPAVSVFFVWASGLLFLAWMIPVGSRLLRLGWTGRGLRTSRGQPGAAGEE